MNQFQMNQYYLIFLIIILIENFKIILTQEANINSNNITSLNDDDPLTTTTTDQINNQTATKPLLENSQSTIISTNQQPTNDFVDDIFYPPPQKKPPPLYPPPSTYYPTVPAFQPSPSSTFHYPTIKSTSSDKLFELSFKKKFFPFGGLSLDIKRYKNDPILYQQQQYQQSINPLIESPYLILPYSDSLAHFNSKTKLKPPTHTSSYFGNIFTKSFDWGAIIKVPGIAIKKFGKLGINIFSGSNSGNSGHNTVVDNHATNGLISGGQQMPTYGYIDERDEGVSKVA